MEPRWYWWLYTSVGWVMFSSSEVWRGSTIDLIDRTVSNLTCTDDPGDWMAGPELALRALWNPTAGSYASVVILQRRAECDSIRPGGGGAPGY
jgi:hypothetical protein